MLRAFFVHLSENRSLRRFAESSAIGRRLSSRFVAGTEIADAVRAIDKLELLAERWGQVQDLEMTA